MLIGRVCKIVLDYQSITLKF